MDEVKTLDRKGEALAEFIRRLHAGPAGDQIAQIVLYGSYARGEAGPESDVDVLILTAGPEREVERAVGEIAGDLMLEFGERIEPMVYTVGETADPSPFVYRTLRQGQSEYRMNRDRLAQAEIRALLELARMYLDEARRKYEPGLEGSRRLTADGAYNAIELAAKAFLRGAVEQLPKTHDGVSRRFSELFVLTGIVPRTFGGRLTTALRLRNRARYDRLAHIEAAQVTESLNFAEDILRALEAHLAREAAAAPPDESQDESS